MTFLYIIAAIVGGFVALMLIMRVVIQLKSTAMKGRTAPELNGKPGKYVKRGRPALFYFYSPSCGACASMTPEIKRLSKSKDGVFPVDISSDMATARKFGVMATPTLVIVKNRVIENILIGPQPAALLEGYLS